MQSRKIFLTVLLVLALMGTALVGTVAASADDPDSSEGKVDLMGVIEAVDTDTNSLVVSGSTVMVDEATEIKKDAERLELADLQVGWTVKVEGSLLPDGTVLAEEIKVVSEEPLTEGIHPVGLALATFFDALFEDIMTWHEEGIGFGNMAKAFFLSEALGEDGLSAGEILAMKLSGTGWGRIMKALGLKPGKGKNLGQMMSGHADDEASEGDSVEAYDHPGKGHGPPDKDKIPPGLEKKGKGGGEP